MTQTRAINRRQLLISGAGAAFLPLTRSAIAAAENPVVVELFTSQGCSSCPPADAFIIELKKMKGVVALTYHVDYWDYLGWQDTLGSAENSRRQYDYAKSRGDMDVYTPQMIINGRKHVVGSDKSAVLAAIAQARQDPPAVSLKLSATDTELVVDIAAGAPMGDTTLWLMPIVSEIKVKILKGENASEEIAYHNVVREMVPAGMWDGKAKQFALPKAGVLAPGSTGCVALLQQGMVGPILACATWGSAAA